MNQCFVGVGPQGKKGLTTFLGSSNNSFYSDLIDPNLMDLKGCQINLYTFLTFKIPILILYQPDILK